MQYNELTRRRLDAINILFDWSYELYKETTDPGNRKYALELFFWMKRLKRKINIPGMVTLTNDELDVLHTMWDEYENWKRNNDA